MKGCFLIFCIAILVGIETAWCFEWENESITLTSSELTEITVEDNSTEFYLSIEDLDKPGIQEYYIYLWIEDMSCTKYKPKPDGTPDYSLPNYLKITAESEEFTISPWTICENITEDLNKAFGYNSSFEIFEPNSVKITPIGEYWSSNNETSGSRATIIAQLRKKRTLQFVFGNEMDQIDININPGKIYSIDIINKDTCPDTINFSCTTAMTVMKMDCKSWDDANASYLEIVMEDGGKVKFEQFCKNVNYNANSYADVHYFESTGNMTFRSVGLSNVRLSANLVLSSKFLTECPKGYFNCGSSNGTKCIRETMECDGRPNCPSSYPVEENDSVCKYDYYYGDCWGYRYGDGLQLSGFLLIFLLIAAGLGLLFMTFRCLRTLFRKPRPLRRTVGVVHDPMAVPPPAYNDAVKMQPI